MYVCMYVCMYACMYICIHITILYVLLYTYIFNIEEDSLYLTFTLTLTLINDTIHKIRENSLRSATIWEQKVAKVG